jgi:hypothetical protein
MLSALATLTVAQLREDVNSTAEVYAFVLKQSAATKTMHAR